MIQRGLATKMFVLMAALAGSASAQSSSPQTAIGSLDLCKGGGGGGGGGGDGGGSGGGGSGGGGGGSSGGAGASAGPGAATSGAATGAAATGAAGNAANAVGNNLSAFALRAVYFRHDADASIADCLTEAYTQRLPLELCR